MQRLIPRRHDRAGWFAAGLAAAGGAVGCTALALSPAPADRSAASLFTPLESWLTAEGADVAQVTVAPSEMPGAGLGLLLRPRVAAAAPPPAGEAAGTGTPEGVAPPGAPGGSTSTGGWRSRGRWVRVLSLGMAGRKPLAFEPEAAGATAGSVAAASAAAAALEAGPRQVASFPLSATFTAPALAARDPRVADLVAGKKPWVQRSRLAIWAGFGLASWSSEVDGSDPALDDREVVVAWLAAQRAGGGDSRVAAWVYAVPESFDGAVWWSDAELDALKGTTLGRAALLRRRSLERRTPALLAAARHLAVGGDPRAAGRSAGGGGPADLAPAPTPAHAFPHSPAMLSSMPHNLYPPPRQPSAADVRWADAAFWSRAMALPLEGVAAAAVPGTAAETVVVEGIVPGLDFANSGRAKGSRGEGAGSAPPDPSLGAEANSAWAVIGGAVVLAYEGDDAAASSRVAAPPTSPASAAAGDADAPADAAPASATPIELTIDYGSKSNEELAFSYGFTFDNNPSDSLMLAGGLASLGDGRGEDALDRARMLVKLDAAPPRIFLPVHAGARPGAGGAEDGADASLPARTLAPSRVVPPEAWVTLEALVAPISEIRQRLEEVAAGGAAAAATRASAPPSRGTRLAVLSALAAMLERKGAEMEDPEEGTGSLEADEAHLRAYGIQLPSDGAGVAPREGGGGASGASDASSLASPPASQTQSFPRPPPVAASAAPVSQVQHAQSLPPRFRIALEYRAAQKRAAREWLTAVRAAQEVVMREMASAREGKPPGK